MVNRRGKKGKGGGAKEPVAKAAPPPVVAEDGGFMANIDPEEAAEIERKKEMLAQTLYHKQQQMDSWRVASQVASKTKVIKEKSKEARDKKKESKLIAENYIDMDDEDYYVCTLCNKKLVCLETLQDHCRTSKHQDRLQWKLDELAKKEKEKARGLREYTIKDLPGFVEYRTADESLYCTLCRKTYWDYYEIQEHFQHKRHLNKLDEGEDTGLRGLYALDMGYPPDGPKGADSIILPKSVLQSLAPAAPAPSKKKAPEVKAQKDDGWAEVDNWNEWDEDEEYEALKREGWDWWAVPGQPGYHSKKEWEDRGYFF